MSGLVLAMSTRDGAKVGKEEVVGGRGVRGK